MANKTSSNYISSNKNMKELKAKSLKIIVQLFA